jgi:hypothetical protein
MTSQSSLPPSTTQTANIPDIPPTRPKISSYSPLEGSNNAPATVDVDTISEQGRRVSFEALNTRTAQGVRCDQGHEGPSRSTQSTAYTSRVLSAGDTCIDTRSNIRKSYPPRQPLESLPANQNQPTNLSRPCNTISRTTGATTDASQSSTTTLAPAGQASFKRNAAVMNNPYSQQHGHPRKAGRNSL